MAENEELRAKVRQAALDALPSIFRSAQGAADLITRWPRGYVLRGGREDGVTTRPLLDVQGLSVRIAMPRTSQLGRRPVLHAVRDVSFSLRSGGLVGEKRLRQDDGRDPACRRVCGISAIPRCRPSQAGCRGDAAAPATPAPGLPGSLFGSQSARACLRCRARTTRPLMPDASKSDREKRTRELFGLGWPKTRSRSPGLGVIGMRAATALPS